MITNIVLVGFGGALGAILRFLINEIFYKLTINEFPLSTLLINIIGCFFIGLVAGFFIPIQRFNILFFYYWILRLIYYNVSFLASSSSNVKFKFNICCFIYNINNCSNNFSYLHRSIDI